ncbi:hypothetical protein ICR44_004676, partial [Vibrio parahaemolyticus]|nr:hypothetical protein [Vibrio parahaemolyticus]EGR1321921.1 hypothetical protein [Vibrio parahaemolyticus]EGR1918080.1 hypothetical protein [Vibrio parahaemolyticus]EGR2132689.1 hypothetical protein [Vibrio parahaemolyticus]EHK3903736.1 hypothetical protein [Vibrio parahaemolyticus]
IMATLRISKGSSNLQFVKDKLEFFKNEYGDNVCLFSMKSAVEREDAIHLYENFDDFLIECKDVLGESQHTDVMNVLYEVIHYFNLALDLLPSLSQKSGSFVEVISTFLKDPKGPSSWNSYSIQFGLPAGVSLALHFSE